MKVETLHRKQSAVEMKTNLRSVNHELFEPFIEILLSESNNEFLYIPPHRSTLIVSVMEKPTMLHSFHTLITIPSSSTFSHPPLHPNSQTHLNVMQCLCKLSTILRLYNELVQLDFDAIDYHKVLDHFLLSTFNGNMVFELPPCCPLISMSVIGSMEGIDKEYDGNA